MLLDCMLLEEGAGGILIAGFGATVFCLGIVGEMGDGNGGLGGAGGIEGVGGVEDRGGDEETGGFNGAGT